MHPFIKVVLACALAMTLLTGCAKFWEVAAQEVATGPSPVFIEQSEPLIQQIMETLAAAALPIIGGVLLLIINSVAGFIKDKFGIDIEARHREALHSALITGIRIALVRLGWVPGTPVPPQALTMAVDYAKSKGAPEAITAMNATTETLVNIAESKIPEVTAEITASGPDATTIASR